MKQKHELANHYKALAVSATYRTYLIQDFAGEDLGFYYTQSQKFETQRKLTVIQMKNIIDLIYVIEAATIQAK